ncbi:cytochrome P450 [Raphidocelis subcapitata]|uniref:Cytochrome P450 n=1 Tax=Raphidocelis subcapitata TaxID=307507 RepID=A0A2V0PNH3_9CHLO|nr:cytochrome P450 [Raphidocelis subcapitata]|eukprot:GBF98675.1 cytochrome P450 [Raphidocelis subcapitata]
MVQDEWMPAAAWTLAALLAALVALVAARAARRAAQLLRIPSPPAPSLLLGHLPAILSPRAPFYLAEWAEACGPVTRLRMAVATKPLLVVSDPAEAAKVLRRGPSYLPKSRALYAALEIGIQPRTPNMLTASDGPVWKAVRACVAPAFSATSLKQVLPSLLDLTHRSADAVAAKGPGGEVDVSDLAKRITSDVMGLLLFGEDLGGVSGKQSEYLAIFNDLLAATHARFINPLRPLWVLWSAQARRQEAAVVRHNVLMGEMTAALQKSPPPDYTIAHHILNAKDPVRGQPLDTAQLKAEIGIVFGAGFETTSHAISWTLGAVAAHPEVQERLVRELAAAGLAPTADAPQPRGFEWSDGGRLPYLQAVIRESLRLFSPASLGTTRETDREIELGGYLVPRGVMVMFSPFVAGLQTRLYGDDVMEFKPERWAAGGGAKADGGDAAGADAARVADQDGGGAAAGAERGPPDPLPFSTGPRDCAGLALAYLELQVVVATLVGRFSWTIDGAASAADLHALAGYHVTLQAEGGLRLRAAPRAPVEV